MLIEFLIEHSGLTAKQVNTQFSYGQIKVNGLRIKTDVRLHADDIVEIFIPIKFVETNKIEVLYIDDNIVIINKPKRIETEDTGGVVSRLANQLDKTVYAVHRLDRNTSGIMVFALNELSYNQLLFAFKNHLVDKIYYAVVCGVPSRPEAALNAYLFKDAAKSLCYISDTFKKGFFPITTQYKLIKKINNRLSLLEVKIETGRTHQIRAHLSHIGLPILGDGKYGNNKINKSYNAKSQCLVSSVLKFQFEKGSYLHYLNDKDFIIDYNKQLKINELTT